ncbi:MAG: hypothetical protein M3542_03580 [Acidobacteriota bacterium]|nr:hypothetical protein [Acidobacteriota bacterium]MDQ5871888.1 hypothetical protein [Acidobacteriota bacterium]
MKSALGSVLVVSLLLVSCASRNPGTAVTVTRSRETVRDCAFLGGVRSTDANDEDGASAGSLQQQTADRDGNVLLMLGAGVGEAYRCEQRLIVSGEANPRPTRYRPGAAPTPTPLRP